jgi:hypothetical protein
LGGSILARINIEDSLFKEVGFTELAILLGSRTMALGALMEAFMLAQEHYLNEENDRLIPLSEWKRNKIRPEVIESGMAVLLEKGVYVRGSKEQFLWLIQKAEAGRKGGLKRAENASKQSQALLGSAIAGPSGAKPLTLSLSQEKNTYIHTNELPDQISKAWSVWNDTLEAFGIPRTNIAPPQESSIARGIKSLGIENVLLALTGARFESPGKDFRPQDHLTIDRALHKDRFGKSNWERFKNLALESSSKMSAINEEEEARRIAEHGRATV